MIWFLLSTLVLATNRIDSYGINQLEAQKIYVSFGRSSVLIFPCNVVSFSDGPTKDIQALLNDRNSKMIEVWFTKNNPEPQELKVFCQEERFVFDIIPSSTTHQSIMEVSRSFRSKKTPFHALESVEKPKFKNSIKIVKSSSKEF